MSTLVSDSGSIGVGAGTLITSRLATHSASAPVSHPNTPVVFHPLNSPVTSRAVITRSDSPLSEISPHRITLTPRASTPVIPGSRGVVSNLVQTPVNGSTYYIRPQFGLVPNPGTSEHINTSNTMALVRQDNGLLAAQQNLVSNASSQLALQIVSRGANVDNSIPTVTTYPTFDSSTFFIVIVLVAAYFMFKGRG